MRRLIPTLLCSALVAIVGCASSTEEAAEGASTAEALSAARQEYDEVLSGVAEVQSRCAAEGRCEGSAIGTAGIRPLGLPSLDLRGIKICDALRPLARLESPYFFVGVSAQSAVIKTIADTGADLVFDLANQQAALFHYHTHGHQNLIGVTAAAYTGYGFGKKANVLEAWSGTFQQAEATIDVPLLEIGVGGLVFRSPDNSIWGGAVEASFGFNALGPISMLEVSASEGDWTAWDAATTTFGRTLFLVRYEEKRAQVGEETHTLLQFRGAKDLALALVERLGPGGALPAAQAVALAALRKKNLTIDAVCP